MESRDSGLPSYFHHSHSTPPPPPTTNGVLPSVATPQMLYPHNSAPSAVVRRKRGRPRKYSTPEQAAAAKRLSSSLSSPSKKDSSLGLGGSPSPSLGNAGQGFTPHIITVTAGEDINYKIMSFMQQSKQEICILSASGLISNASLRQPATTGGNITYEGRFNILSLCGSYLHTDAESSSSSGGLSVCLSSNDGQIIGGSVDGPLIAVSPVQVILGAFVIDHKRPATIMKAEASTNQSVSPPTGLSLPSLSFLSAPSSSGRNMVMGSKDQENTDGYQFMIPNRAIPDWRSNNDTRTTHSYDFSGRGNSPENRDYDDFQD